MIKRQEHRKSLTKLKGQAADMKNDRIFHYILCDFHTWKKSEKDFHFYSSLAIFFWCFLTNTNHTYKRENLCHRGVNHFPTFRLFIFHFNLSLSVSFSHVFFGLHTFIQYSCHKTRQLCVFYICIYYTLPPPYAILLSNPNYEWY